jgi:hypothetical protein
MPRLIPVFVFLFLLAPFTHAQITGDQRAEAITRLNQPRDASIVANSVDTGTGAFSIEATVLSVNGGRPLQFTALYDSIVPPTGIISRPRSLGLGWTHPYSSVLEGNPDGLVTVWWDDNRRNSFEKQGSVYVPREESAQYDQLTRQGDDSWRLARRDGTEYRFDADGKLTQIANKIRQAITVQREANGRILKLIEPVSGKELLFRYPDANSLRISDIADPAGRLTYFLYDRNGRLRALPNPASFGSSNGPAFVPKAIPDNSPAGLRTRFPSAAPNRSVSYGSMSSAWDTSG